ncbi:MAG TPA: matrixin family metalloprotease [Candidatus Limosilactobacillus intestinavium]|nr:matrixin family metalloprotease [Candidatus Limosilactobacillus intestinavium]
MWFYNDNHQFQRQTDNSITYLKTALHQLDNQSNGNSKANTNAQHQQSTIDSQHDEFRGRWTNRQATIFIDMNNQVFKQAMEEAVQAWNNTGAFKFRIVKNRQQADIVATTSNNQNNQAAGLTEMSVSTMSGYFTGGHIYLNKAYLLNPVYNYSHERIVNTAEHELGHAIGLSHNNAQSVMQPSGSFFSIQNTDVQAVNNLYSKKPEKSN